MGWYSRVVFPRLCDWQMRQQFLHPYRSELLADVDGEILEIGFGTGLNLPHYPDRVRRIVAVDPSPGMSRIAQRRIQHSRVDVEKNVLGGENLPFDDDRFDCVVSSWTLCSIADVRQALSQLFRVLKPGGRYFFLEHGLSDDAGIQKWQRRLNPLQKRLADGCRLDLAVDAVVREQPFQDVNLRRFTIPGIPRILGSMYRGVATK